MKQFICLAAIALAACNDGTAPSSRQDQGLNEADALLNEAPNGLDAIDDQDLGENADANAQ